jgi:hypothetical protein
MSDTSTNSDVEAMDQEKASSQENWTPTKREWAIMISLAFISMMVALDATILVTVLPVSHIRFHHATHILTMPW